MSFGFYGVNCLDCVRIGLCCFVVFYFDFAVAEGFELVGEGVGDFEGSTTGAERAAELHDDH